MGISNNDTDISDESHAGDSHADNVDDGQPIQLKSCPRCKTPIRKSLRYGNVIKQQLNDIEKVKEKLLGEKNELERRKERLYGRHSKMHFMLDKPEWLRLERSIRTLNSEWMAAVLENKLTLLERFFDTRKKMKSILGKMSQEVFSENGLQGKFEFYLTESKLLCYGRSFRGRIRTTPAEKAFRVDNLAIPIRQVDRLSGPIESFVSILTKGGEVKRRGMVLFKGAVSVPVIFRVCLGFLYCIRCIKTQELCTFIF